MAVALLPQMALVYLAGMITSITVILRHKILRLKSVIQHQMLQIAMEKIEAVIGQITESPALPPQIKVLIRARPKWITELIAQYKASNPNVSFIISNDSTIADISGFEVIVNEEAEQ